MKQIFTFATLTLLSGAAFGQTVEDANILLGNMSSNLYWDSYNDNTKIVNDLNFSVYADGTNSDYVTPAFTIKVYIWDGSDATFVRTYNDPGLYHFGGRDYENQDIDLSDLQLPAGSYRLGVYVDADDDIPSSADDDGDNAYLTQGNINFTPGGGSSAGIGESQELNTLMVFPNPVGEKVTIAWENTDAQAEILEIRDLNGRTVQSLELGANATCANLNVSDLNAGVYVVAIRSAKHTATQKFIKQ
jgi:hypothetical protein